jgi:hypothetical protein
MNFSSFGDPSCHRHTLLCMMDLLSSISHDMASKLAGVLVQLFELVINCGYHPCCRVPISFCRLGLLDAHMVCDLMTSSLMVFHCQSSCRSYLDFGALAVPCFSGCSGLSSCLIILDQSFQIALFLRLLRITFDSLVFRSITTCLFLSRTLSFVR